MNLFHLTESQLRDYADRTTDQSTTDRLSNHLAGCSRCRDRVMLHRQIHEQVTSLPLLAASDATLARILASRAAGARTILPLDDARPAPDAPRRLGVLLAASVVLAVAAGLFAQRGRTPEFNTEDGELSGISSLFIATGMMPSTAEAASITRGSLAPLVGRRLEPMTLAFRREWVSGAKGSERRTVDGAATFSVEPRTLGRDSAWLIQNSWSGLSGGRDVDNARTQVESIYVERGTLRPLARGVHVTPYRRYSGINISQRFVGDSVVGEMTLRDMTVRRPVVGNLASSSGRLVPSEAMGPVFLMGVALHDKWSAELDMLGWSVVPRDILHPFVMRVVGSERVTVPAGTFDCWKVAILIDGHTQLTWLRKSDQLGVLVRGYEKDPRGTREVVLTSEGHPR